MHQRDVEKLLAWGRKLNGIRGPGVKHNANGITIVPTRNQSGSLNKGYETVIVRVTAAAASGGCYDGTEFVPNDMPISPASVTASSIGTDGFNVLIVNFAELGKSTHDLTDGTPTITYFLGVWLGATNESTPRRVAGIWGIDVKDCT